MSVNRSFEDPVAEGAAVPTEGWDFSWFAGRADEERPSWGYAVSAGQRRARAEAVLDIQTPSASGPTPRRRAWRWPGCGRSGLRTEFHDIAAVVHFLRKVVRMVPGFTVEAYEPRLRAPHERIQEKGPFVAHSTRHLFDLRKPD